MEHIGNKIAVLFPLSIVARHSLTLHAHISNQLWVHHPKIGHDSISELQRLLLKRYFQKRRNGASLPAPNPARLRREDNQLLACVDPVLSTRMLVPI
jgi:hypothetical protein